MRFTIDEALLPATLTAAPMTDQQFADFCAEHPDLYFETTASGEIVVMPPNFSMTGARNLEVCVQLGNWARKMPEELQTILPRAMCFQTVRGGLPMRPGQPKNKSSS
jgi:Uma2 family endonuclease